MAVEDWCRHCGDFKRLTEEHLPPRSAGNAEPVTRATEFPDDYHEHPVLDLHSVWPSGHTQPTLCDDCNFKPSNWGYVSSYKGLRDHVIAEAHIRSANNGGYDPIANDEFGDLLLPYDLNPRRFIAQCVGMIMAAQMEDRLTRDPALRDLIGADLDRESMPPEATGLGGFSAWLTLANKDFQYARRPVMQSRGTEFSFIWTFIFSPFAFCLSDGGSPGWGATEITDWSELGHHVRFSKSNLRLKAMPSMPMGKQPLFPD